MKAAKRTRIGNRRAEGAHQGIVGVGHLTPILAAIPVAASVLDIPNAELTPRVKVAIDRLIAEVERLKKETAEMRARLTEAAHTADQDTLVPLLNRRAFVREISRFISLAGRYGTPSSLVYVDLDDFKRINDEHGHAAGDAMLRHIADVLTRQVRDTDVVARIGGDEFGVVLAHVNLAQAEKKAAALDRALRVRPLVFNGHTLALGFSFGCYELAPGESADSAIARADAAMYERKRTRSDQEPAPPAPRQRSSVA
jgi:diguanylate cyclase (GGDEF)-like protein